MTPWLSWFLGRLPRAMRGADAALASVSDKARFWQRWVGTSINERQTRVLNRALDGFEGKLTNAKWAAIGKCSADTALRDINDLLTRGVLRRLEGGGRSTGYELCVKWGVSERALFGRPVQGAEFVAVRVTQIGQVNFAGRAFAKPWRVFAGRAAIGDSRRMKSVTLLGRLHGEPNGAAVAVGRGLAVDWRGDRERARGAAIKIPLFVGNPWTDAQRAEQRVVKLFRSLKVIDTEHHVAKHRFLRLRTR